MDSALSNPTLNSCLTHSIISDTLAHSPTPSLSPERTVRKSSLLHDQPTIKMEDLEQQSNAATLSGAGSTISARSSESPETSRPGDGKHVKKRKSWGQVLPEPKTNLPPRKRAKTADEKEQRRIERVKRNRLAAHNSRERKRQEVELLQQEKDVLEQRLTAAEESNAKMAAQLAAFRRMMPGVSPSPEPIDSLASTDSPEPSPKSALTINPRQTSFPSPESMDMDSVDSPLDTSSQPGTPAADEPTLADLDRTQHSAVSVEARASFLGHREPALGGDPMMSFPHPDVVDSPFEDSFFDFDHFCEPPSAAAPDFEGTSAEAALFGGDAHFAVLAAFDQFGAKPFDLHADSGATDFVCDESGIAV